MTLHDIEWDAAFPKLPSKLRRCLERIKNGFVTGCETNVSAAPAIEGAEVKHKRKVRKNKQMVTQ